MKKLFALLAILCCTNLFSQSEKIDILKKFNSYKTIDTVKCRLLTELIEIENNNSVAADYNNLLEKYVGELKNSSTQKQKIAQFQTTVLVNKGYFAIYESDYTLAQQYYFAALQLAEKNNDIESMCSTYNSLGTIFSDLNESEKSFQYYKKAEALALKHNKEKKLGIIYNNIGYQLVTTGQLDSGYLYYKKSLRIREKLKDSLDIMQTIANMGGYFSRKENNDAAIALYSQCLEYEEKNNDEIGAFSSALNISQAYYNKANIPKAAEYAEKALSLSQKNQYHYGVLKACEYLEIIYEKQKKYKKVIEILNLKESAKDSLNESESKEALYKTEFKYENQKKEAQIKNLAQEKTISELESKRQKSITLVLIVVVSALLTISFLLFKRYQSNKQNELLKMQIEETQKTLIAQKKATESELKALKSQMNPHFIFNALNSIQEEFMFGDKIIANEQMGNFTSLTRDILTVSGKKNIPIEKEIEILTKYLELEKMRFGQDFDYAITCSENIDESYHQIPPMIVQPFVENSIKHGLLHKQGYKKVTAHFALNEEENILICTVQDNGIGRKKSAEIKSNNRHNSFSTDSIAQRLQLLNGNETRQSIIYEDLVDKSGIANGTLVTIEINLDLA